MNEMDKENSIIDKTKNYLKITKSIRIKLFIVFLIFNIIVTLVGVLTPLSSDIAQAIIEQIEPLFENLSTSLIIGNNLSIALIAIIPIVGLFWMIFTLYSTGLAFSAIATVSDVPALFLILFTFITPFFWLEYIAYSLAMMEGTMIVYTLLIKRERIREELIITILIIGLMTLLLAFGALLEALMIGIM